MDRYPDGPANNAAFQVFEDLDSLDPLARGPHRKARPRPSCASTPRPWRPSPNGAPALRRSCARGGLYPALESHLAKYCKLVPTLALAFHLSDLHHGPVGFASTLRALH